MTLVINLFQTSSVLPLTKNFENDSFLLVHGTGDGKLVKPEMMKKVFKYTCI